MGAIFSNYYIDVLLNGILMIEFMMINFLFENIHEKAQRSFKLPITMGALNFIPIVQQS
jgi:hypothetical protein